MPITFTIRADGPAEKWKTNWYAKRDGSQEQEFLVAQSVSYKDADGKHWGLYQDRVKDQLPAVYYDRMAAEASLGLWAHFIWPSVTAEGGGHHLIVNTYDRAAFTFGFYQLAAHTPGDNLILLFRALLALPKAKDYFPDLMLKDGKVHRTDGAQTYSLEAVTAVSRPNGTVEKQLVAFMTYLNPHTLTVGEPEARNAAKLIHWLQHDPAALNASVETAFGIMRKKVNAAAATFGLKGKDPRLAIWVSDIKHQGRGGKNRDTLIKAPLAKPTLAEKLAALYLIGSDVAGYTSRRNTVKQKIATLTAEGRFNGVILGDANLPLG